MIKLYVSRSAFLLSAIMLAACGGGDAKSEPIKSVPVTTPPAATKVAELTPMERGARIYKRCQSCHTLEEGGKHRVGPNLWDIYGSKAGSKEGFAYSKAMLASGVTWDEDSMDQYMTRPKEFMPGNKMSFIGLKKAEDRAAVQAYIKAKTTPAK